MAQLVGGHGRDRPSGDAPQRRICPDFVERLEQCDRGREPARQHRVCLVGNVVEGKEGQHAREHRAVAERGDIVHDPDIGSAVAQRVEYRTQLRVFAVPRRQDDQPCAVRCSRRSRLQRSPGDVVAKRIHNGFRAFATPPPGKCWQRGRQRGLVGLAQGAGQCLQIFPLDCIPEPRFRLRDRDFRKLGFEPVAISLEGVGGEFGGARPGGGEVVVPAGVGAVGDESGECGVEGLGFGLVVVE